MYRPSFSKPGKDNNISNTPAHGSESSETYGNITRLELPKITYAERQKGGVGFRYFVQHRSTYEMFEISSSTYKALNEKREKYDYLAYKVVKLSWDFTSPIKDEQHGKYVLEGSNTKNLKQVEKIKYEIVGLRDYLVSEGELFI